MNAEAYIDDPELFNMVYKKDVMKLSVKDAIKAAVCLGFVVGVTSFLFAACSMWTINEDTRSFCEAIYLV